MNTAEQINEKYEKFPLHLIRPNPKNRNLDNLTPEQQRSFDELVQSVLEKGIIQPIILRDDPEKDGFYQIVAGERRWRAKVRAGEIKGIPLTEDTIIAIYRNYSDEECEDARAIENFHRQDFSPLEEAYFFKEQVSKMGNSPDTFKSLAKTYGWEESAIRLRIALLSLPENIQRAFDEKTITIGHAELFCKISDPEFQKATFNSCVANRWTIKELNTAIKSANPKMKWAKFDTEPCKICLSNSSVQRQLFETEEESVCLQPSCFREKQFGFFEQGWNGSKGQEKFGTTGFRFHDDLDPARVYPITTDIAHTRCETCPEFVTAGTLAGGRVEGRERVCIGAEKCYQECYAAPAEKPAAAEDSPESVSGEAETATATETTDKADKTAESSAADKQKKLAERAKQRGVEQREALYADKLPEFIGNIDAKSPPAIRIALIALLLTSRSAQTAIVEDDSLSLEGKGELKSGYNKAATANFVLNIPKEQLLEVLKVAATGTIMEGSDSGPEVRHRTAALVGVEIDQHWTIHEEYLKGQTKDEIVLLGEEPQVDLWNDEKVKDYREEKFGKKGWLSLKKSDLIDCCLKSGADLKGKVPLELTQE